MNTEEDWKREREFERTCSNCHGRGWTHEGGPCGCDEPTDPPALPPRHEAPACETCFECGSTERTGTACKPCNPEITDPNFGHEAPAEGAGERDRMREIDTLTRQVTPDLSTAQWLLASTQEVTEPHLRARSSAPEALGNLLAVIHGDGGHRALEVGTKQAALEAEKIVAGLFAAPSADKLRGLVGASEDILSALSALSVAGKPIASLDTKLRDAINTLVPALAALQAEQKGGA